MRWILKKIISLRVKKGMRNAGNDAGEEETVDGRRKR